MTRAENFIQKINYIINFFVDPCDAPITVYAELAFPALIDALLTYFEFQPDEIIIQSFRTSAAPNLARSKRKGGRGSKSGRNKFTKKAGKIINFDPNEEAGKKIGNYGKLPKVLTGVKAFLWTLEGLAERLSFYIFLAELILDFFYSWFSLLNRSEFCQKAAATTLYATNGQDNYAAVIGYNPMAFPNVHKIRGKVEWNAFGGTFTGQKMTVIAGGTFFNFPPQAPANTVTLLLHVQFPNNPTVFRYYLGSGIVSGVGPQEIAGERDIPGPCSFGVEVVLDAGFAYSTGASISMFAEEYE